MTIDHLTLEHLAGIGSTLALSGLSIYHSLKDDREPFESIYTYPMISLAIGVLEGFMYPILNDYIDSALIDRFVEGQLASVIPTWLVITPLVEHITRSLMGKSIY